MKKPALALLVLIGVVVATWLMLRLWPNGPSSVLPERPLRSGDLPEGTVSCDRIVSMAPSLTETLFALGLGPRVVGVTRFCSWPPEVSKLPRVGGFLDPDYERIVSLAPTVVMLTIYHEEQRARLENLGLATLTVRQELVDDIHSSILQIGSACGVASEARQLVASLEASARAIETAYAGMPRPSVLIAVGREMGTGEIKDVFVAGKGTFYDQLIRMAGGTNVYDGYLLDYPTLSNEAILRLNPQVIIEIAPELSQRGLTEADAIRDWAGLKKVHAVRDHRIHVITQNWAAIPGPRYVMLLKKFARILHPD